MANAAKVIAPKISNYGYKSIIIWIMIMILRTVFRGIVARIVRHDT